MTVVGDHSIVRDGAVIGEGCRIGTHVLVEAGAVLGDRVTLESGTQIWNGVTLEDDVFVGPNATFANVLFPRSGRAPEDLVPTTVRAGASIGANATVVPGVEVGARAMVGAGAVVSRSVPREAIVVGNPARIVGYVEARRDAAMRPIRVEPATGAERTGVVRSAVRGVTLRELPVSRDLRGSLVAGEVPDGLPFVPHRYFLVFDVPGADVRGEHAHRECHQLLVCVSGQLHVVADDGEHRQEFVLEHMRHGLYLPPMTWGIQYRYSPGSVLLVFASHPYDPDDYIRDYGEFLQLLE
jgi:acetyltransferase-like isoleucine patch superfamily enzyme/dTDP-4-dehydrorhamnose 3,5-epimerase-like enzyme